MATRVAASTRAAAFSGLGNWKGDAAAMETDQVPNCSDRAEGEDEGTIVVR